MSEDTTLHTNAIDRLFRVISSEEMDKGPLYIAFLSLLRDLLRSSNVQFRERMELLSKDCVQFEDYESLADLLEGIDIIPKHNRIKHLLASGLRNVRAGV